MKRALSVILAVVMCFLSMPFVASAQELSETDVSIVGSTVQADGLYIKAEGERDLTVTISGIDVEDTYMTNLSSSEMDICEYMWEVAMYMPEETYSVATSSWVFEPGLNEEKSIDDMQSDVWYYDDIGAGVIDDATVDVSYTDHSITWSFAVPESYDFSFSTIEKFVVNIYNVDDVHIERTYNVTGKSDIDDSKMNIVVDDVDVMNGEDAVVNIVIPNNPGVALVGFDVKYDSNVMTLINAEQGEIFSGELDCNLDKVPFTFLAYTGKENKTASGTLVTLTFKVDKNCPAGNYAIELENIEALNIDEEDVECAATNGSVNVTVPEKEKMNIVVGEAAVYGGEDAVVNITIPNNPGVALVGFDVKYDSSVMTLINAEQGEIFSGELDCNLDKVPFTFLAYTGKENKTANGTLVTLTFEVDESADIGEYAIELENVEVLNIEEEYVEYAVTNGLVTVKGADFAGLSFKNKKVTYNGEVQTIEVAGAPAGAVVEYTVDGAEFNGAKAVGEYEVIATVTAPGYNKWKETATLTIEKKPLVINIDVPSKEYDGTNKIENFIDCISFDGVVDGDDVFFLEEECAGEYKAANAGTHEVVWDVVIAGDDHTNYELDFSVPKATITPKAITIKVSDVTVKVGDELPEKYEYTVTPELGEGYAELVGTVTTSAKNTNTVKDYDIKATFTAKNNPNYAITVENGKLHVIDKDKQDVTIADVADVTYGDEGFKLEVALGEKVTSSEVEYESLTPAIASVDEDGYVTILGAGTAKIAVTKAGDADYADVNETVEFTVAKKAVTVTADNKTATKGDAIPELTYTVDGLVGDDAIEATLTTSAKNTNTIKDYPITVKVTVKNYPNYAITLVNGTLSVVDKTKQNITVIANVPEDLTYGDEGFKIDVEYGDVVTDAPTTFASSDEEVAKVDENGNVTVIGAGKATITVSKAGNDTIADFNEEVEVVVAKKAIRVEAVDNQKKQGNEDPELTYVVTGELVGDDVFTGNVAREKGEDVGEYIIGPGTLSLTNSDNYDVDFVGGKFTIFDKTPQNIELTASYSKTYGDEPFALDIAYGTENVADAVTTFASSDEDVVAVDAEGNVTVVGAGKAKITVTRAGNEDLADFSKNVTVNVAPKAIKVTAVAKTKYVGEETPELTYTTDVELVPGDEFTGALTVNDKGVAGKSYDIKIGTLALGDNYKITFVGAKLEVLPKVDQEITLSKLDVVTYGDTDIVLNVTYGDINADAEVVFASDNENVATVDSEGKITIVGAGSASISVSVEGNYKYNAFEDDVVLNVDKADIEFVIADTSKRIGMEDPAEFAYKLNGTLYGDTTIVGAPEREAGEKIGEYKIKPGTLTVSDPENYNIGYTWGKFTIVSKNPHNNVTVSDVPASVTYGDEGFTITASSQDVTDAAVSFASDNADVISVDENGVASIGVAGTAVITVTLSGNEDYEDAVVPYTVVVNAKEIAVSELDVVNKTFALEGVLDADASDVALNFNKLTFVTEEVEEGQTPANYVVTGFELIGAKAANYAPSTETMLVAISEDIELAEVAPAPEIANGKVEGVGTYLAGSEVTLTAVANKGYKFAGWYVGEEKVSSSAEYTFTADSDVVLTPMFKKSSSGGGGGGGTPVRTVYFKIDEATTKSVTVDKGEKVAKPEDPTREGYTFAGWFVDAAYTEEYDFGKKVDMSFTLYAKWNEVEKQPEEETGDDEEKPTVWENPYTDVAEGNWFYGAVKAAAEAGLMKGVSEKEFAPSMTVTRAMLVTMLYRAEGEPNVVNNVTFKDVDENAYYADAVTWAHENGIVNGITETEFAPNADITREQIATILFRYAGFKGVEAIELSENLHFDDADEISEYAVAPMNWLVGKNIITGYSDGTVKPKGNATRAEVATMATRMLELLGK